MTDIESIRDLDRSDLEELYLFFKNRYSYSKIKILELQNQLKVEYEIKNNNPDLVKINYKLGETIKAMEDKNKELKLNFQDLKRQNSNYQDEIQEYKETIADNKKTIKAMEDYTLELLKERDDKLDEEKEKR